MESDTLATSALDVHSSQWMELALMALNNTLDTIVIHNDRGEVLYFNEPAARNLGLTVEEFASLPRWGFGGEFTDEQRQLRLRQIREEGESIFFSKRPSPDGGHATFEVHTNWVETDFGPVIVAVSHDVTERVKAQEELRHLAFHDALTGLANRARFNERLASAIESSASRGQGFGLLYLDVNELKTINDRFGHFVGDELLRQLGARLKTGVRADDTVARLGGDEFAVILPDVTLGETLRDIGGEMTERLSETLTIEGHAIWPSVSVGVAVFDPSSDDADSLVSRADGEMYASKRRNDMTRCAVRVQDRSPARWAPKE